MRAFLRYIEFGSENELQSGAVKNTGYAVLECDGNSFRVIETNGIEREEGSEE
jgi:hypothetical protein